MAQEKKTGAAPAKKAAGKAAPQATAARRAAARMSAAAAASAAPADAKPAVPEAAAPKAAAPEVTAPQATAAPAAAAEAAAPAAAPAAPADALAPAATVPPMGALGMLETRGLVAAIEASDAMVKAARVRLIGSEKIGSGLVSIMVCGDVSAVRAAVEAGGAAAAELGEIYALHVIPNPHPDVEGILPTIK